MTSLRQSLVRELAAAADPQRAANLAWFFKTGKGEYGEGDRFLGIAVPQMRRIALRHCDLKLTDIERLLRSKFHEHRAAALEILVAQYERALPEEQDEIADFYLAHTSGINNWDLVDASGPYILGEHLKTRDRAPLYVLAQSESVWERRIAIVSTLALIRSGEIEDTFHLAEVLLDDTHDLIHKATGWMLREAGRISRDALTAFLFSHYGRIPRTCLRYAIEHYPPKERKRILRGLRN